jgi:CheY-like chemotaxis protein
MPKALVIDDDDVARELIVSVLEAGGYEAVGLPSPIGATQTILDRHIEIVVLDLLMPALSGDKLAKMLRSNARLANLLIVLVSSSDIDKLKELAALVRADAVVAKADIRKRLIPTLIALRRRSAAS